MLKESFLTVHAAVGTGGATNLMRFLTTMPLTTTVPLGPRAPRRAAGMSYA